MASVTLDSFFQSFSRSLEEPVRSHLRNVYTCLAMSMLSAAAGAYVHMFTNFFSGGLLSGLAAIGCMIALMMTPDENKNRNTRLLLLLGFAFATGLGLGPLLDIVVMVDPSVIPTALLGTMVIFVCFSAAALLSSRGQWLYLGGTLLSVLSTLFWLSLANIFFGSRLLFEVNLYVGLVVMCGFVLYDTQMIAEKRRLGSKDFIWHSVELFIDFVSIFRRLLIILAQKENQKKRKN